MNVTQLNDNTLVAMAAEQHNRKAFNELVVRYQSPIRRFFLNQTLGNEPLSDDLAQDTFVKAYLNITKFRGDSAFSTWLYRIATYEALNFLKKRRSEEEHRISPSEEADATYLLSRLHADEYFDADEVEERFQKAILTLPAKQQLVFRLRYYDEMPYEQMSKLTGTSEGALKASYHHAHRKILELLGAEE